MSDKTFTILLCGVGGQGTITAATLLARVAECGREVRKVSEILAWHSVVAPVYHGRAFWRYGVHDGLRRRLRR